MLPVRKTGSERFHDAGNALTFDLLSFWQWSGSDLVSNDDGSGTGEDERAMPGEPATGADAPGLFTRRHRFVGQPAFDILGQVGRRPVAILLPKIEKAIGWVLLACPRAQRPEAAQEAIALAWKHYRRLSERGKKPATFPTSAAGRPSTSSWAAVSPARPLLRT